MINANELEKIESILKQEILKYEVESDIFNTTIVIKPANSFILIDGAALVSIAQIKPFVMGLNKEFTITLTF
jgi:hypothetical protein